MLRSVEQESSGCAKRKWKCFSGNEVPDAEDLFQLDLEADGSLTQLFSLCLCSLL